MHTHKYKVVSTFVGGENNGAVVKCECGESKVAGAMSTEYLQFLKQIGKDR